MRRTSPSLPVALAALTLACPAAAPAAKKPPRDLWATVNVCNTANAPNKMGVRARMPGDGTRKRMYMRFIAQFLSGKKWQNVTGRGVSPWLHAGSALFKEEELGFTFAFDAPKPGSGFLLRGLVLFEWRAKHHVHGRVQTVVVRRAQQVTKAGHPSRDADPPGFSAAHCQIGTTAPAGRRAP